MRKGSITVFALITMLIVFSICLYLSYITVMENHLQNNLKYKLQNNYDLETSLNYIVNDFNVVDSDINKSIIKYCNSPTINNKDVIYVKNKDENDEIAADLEYNLKDNNTYLNISINSPNSNFNAKLKASVDFVNEVFTYNKLPYVNKLSFIERPDLEDELVRFFSSIDDSYKIPPLKSGMSSLSLYHSEEIKLKRINANQYWVYRNEAIENYSIMTNEVFIYIENKANYDNVKLTIDSNNKYDYLKGIIYVEGDIHIINNLNFNGIIIINGGEIYIDEGKNATITGKIISNNEFILPDGLQFKYSPDIMNKYGVYLPNYIKSKIKNVKIIY
ncbi:MAG: hypothetical protein H5T96_02040 [Tissierellales bacterium]|nr:hypothetical protein [Tissierellales bacterium]